MTDMRMNELHEPLFFDPSAPFSEDQKAWIAGYFSGLRANISENTKEATTDLRPVSILYGSQTGNAEGIALDMAESCAAFGLAPDLRPLDEIEPEDIADIERLLVVISTYGEGEMPDNAQMFWDSIMASTAPRLEKTHFSVLALGDTSYDGFCEAGKLIDIRLEQLGARRIRDRIDCDVDYEDLAAGWIETALPEIGQYGEGPKIGVPNTDQIAKSGKSRAAKSKWTRKNPYAARLISDELLSGPGSKKEIRHYAFSLEDPDITYEAGDALGVIPVNHDYLVHDLLEALDAAPDLATEDGLSLADALRRNYEILTPSRDFLTAVARKAQDPELSHNIDHGDRETIEDFLWNKDIVDILRLYDVSFGISEFLDLMRPLQHRAYSISSSPKNHPGEVHLTVSTIRYDSHNRRHGGVCSSYLSDILDEGATGSVFVSPNKAFRPPTDPDAPMIMIGPGTGIAPFRAFLEERAACGAEGYNWLFFGDQYRAHDFIYEDELVRLQEDGILARLDLAFSRDQEEKIYVQHKMLESGAALYEKLEKGGYFYVCGDATHMARDVDRALHQLIATHGKLSPEAAFDYVNRLRKEKRYLRDVY